MLALSALAGCEKAMEPAEDTFFAMDTVMHITLYDRNQKKAQTLLNSLTARLTELDGQLSVSQEGSDIAQINRSGGEAVEVRAMTALLLGQALTLCHVTGGALDITAYPAVTAWGFTGDEHRVPDPEELAALAEQIDYTAVQIEGDEVKLPVGMELDLGAVAKGWAGDLLAAEVHREDISSALMDLGQSTITAVGTKPDGSPWRIGVRDPAGEGYFAIVELSDMAMGTSGGYQRYFEEDGVTYWHILDPKTAAPARSGLSSVTVVAPSALICDGLSTALFVMGLEESARFWREHPELEFEALFVTEDGEFYATSGLSFLLAEGYETREVTVLE